MKKVIILIVALCLTSIMAYAEEQATEMPAQAPAVEEAQAPAVVAAPLPLPEMVAVPAPADEVKLSGTIIDNACAGAHGADMAEFVKTHTKECALMPACEASGYSIYSDGKLEKFSANSNTRVAEFLKQPDSSLSVAVTASRTGDELNLISIEKQK